MYHGGTPTWRFHTAKHFDEYLKFGETHRAKTWRSVLFFLSSQFLSFFHWIVFDLFLDVTKMGEWGMGNGEWGMGNGEWGMGNGEWGMGNGEWGMGNGEWGMGNGEWGMGNGKLKMGNCGQRVRGSQLGDITSSLTSMEGKSILVSL